MSWSWRDTNWDPTADGPMFDEFAKPLKLYATKRHASKEEVQKPIKFPRPGFDLAFSNHAKRARDACVFIVL